MKNLKKVLALVLALATVFGLGVTASAKEYTDGNKIEYTEAVDVMSAIGILGGNPDGSFNPQGNLTRAQAAKMVSYLLNSGKDVNDLYAGSNTFTDCSSNWAKGYIAYVNQMGIVSGVGNGKFNPNGTLTGVQLAKMMLTSLGYDAKVEGYQGSDNWQVNIINDAQNAGLLKGLDSVNLYNAITREQASQMMFNALKADMVGYQSKGTEVELPGIGTIITGASTPEAVKSNNDVKYDGKADDKQQLVEKYFSDLKVISTTTDGMGRPAVKWTNKSVTVGTYAETPDYTAYVTTSNNTLAKVVDSISKDFSEATATKTINGGAWGALNNGDFVEIYMDDDNAEVIDVIAVTHKTVNKLTGDVATKTEGKDTLVKVPGITALAAYNSNNTSETVTGYQDLAKDDIVLWYKDNNNNYYLEKAQSFTGTLTATAGTKYTINGTSYNKSGVDNVLDANGTPINVNTFYSESATWYTDNNGNVVWVEGVEATDLAYVVDSIGTQDDWGTWTYQAKLMTMDGTVKTVKTANNYSNDNTGANDLAGKIVTYTVKDEKYTLAAAGTYVAGTTEGQVASGTIGQAVITKGTPSVKLDNSKTVLSNADTVFLVRDYTSAGAAKETYTVYTGYNNVPTITGATGSMVAYVGTNNYAKYVIVDAGHAVSSVTTAADLFYVVSNTVTTLYNADGVYGYSVKGIKNGSNEIVDLQFSFDPSTSVTQNANTPIAADTAYIAATYNKDGQIDSYGAAITTGGEYLVGSSTGKANAGTFKLGSSAYAYTSDTVVYFVNADNELTVMDINGLDDDINNTYVAVRASNNPADTSYNTIKTLYVSEVVVDAIAPTFGTNLSTTDTATAGSAKTFNVAVNNNSGYTVAYAWYVNGAKVEGATSATLSYTFPAAATATVYCVVTYTGNPASVDGNMTSSATSAVCNVTINPAS